MKLPYYGTDVGYWLIGYGVFGATNPNCVVSAVKHRQDIENQEYP